MRSHDEIMASTDGLFANNVDECDFLQALAEEYEDELAGSTLSEQGRKGTAVRLRAVIRSMQQLGCSTKDR